MRACACVRWRETERKRSYGCSTERGREDGRFGGCCGCHCVWVHSRECVRERDRDRECVLVTETERERERTRGLRKGVRRWLSGTVCRERFTLSHKPSLKYSHTHTLSLSHSKTLACAFVVLWEMRIKMRANFSSLCSEQLRVQTEATKIETIFRHLKRIFYDNFVKVTLTVWWKGEL